MTNNTEIKLASMNEVVMKKDELVKVLEENKAKHDVLYETAVAGYWELAKEKLAEKKGKLDAALEELKGDVLHEVGKLEKKLDAKEVLPYSIACHGFKWDSALGLVYPENHTKDYDRAIRMMKASIYDEVKLSEGEFDAYVLNDWEWKQKFLLSNSGYVDTMRTRYGVKGMVGKKLSNSTGCYNSAVDGAVEQFAISGCAAF